MHMLKFFNEWDSLVDNIWGLDSSYSAYSWKLKDDKYSFVIPLVGVKKEDVIVEILDNILSVKAPNYSFAINMPKEYDNDSVEASLDLGLLKLETKRKIVGGQKVVVK